MSADSSRVKARWYCLDCGTYQTIRTYQDDVNGVIRVACGGDCSGLTDHKLGGFA